MPQQLEESANSSNPNPNPGRRRGEGASSLPSSVPNSSSSSSLQSLAASLTAGIELSFPQRLQVLLLNPVESSHSLHSDPPHPIPVDCAGGFLWLAALLHRDPAVCQCAHAAAALSGGQGSHRKGGLPQRTALPGGGQESL